MRSNFLSLATRRLVLAALLLAAATLVQTPTSRPTIEDAAAQASDGSAADMELVTQVFGSSSGALVASGGTVYAGVGVQALRFELDAPGRAIQLTGASGPLRGAIAAMVRGDGFLYATTSGRRLYALEESGSGLAVVSELPRLQLETVNAVPDGLLLTGIGPMAFYSRLGMVELVSLRDPRRPVVQERVSLPLRDRPENVNSSFRTVADTGRAFVFYGDRYGGDFLATVDLEPGPSATVRGGAETDSLNVKDGAVAGDRLFLIDHVAVLVLDISDPTAVRQVQRFEPVPDFYPYRVVTDGELIVVSGSGTRRGIFVLDARDPAAGLPELAHFALDGASVWAMAADGSRLVTVGNSDGGSLELRALDLARDGTLTELGIVRQPGAVRRVAVGEGRVFAVGRSDTWTVEVTPDGVKAGDRITIPAAEVNDLSVAGDHLVATTSAGLFVVHAPPEGAATVVGELPRDPDVDPQLHAQAVAEGFVYAVAIDPGSRSEPATTALWVIDVTVPTRPEVASKTTVPLDVIDVVVADGVAVLLGDALTLVDVSDAAHPRIRGRLATGPDPVGLVNLGAGHVLIAREGRLVVVDITDLDGPAVAAELLLLEKALSVGGDGDTAFALLRSRNPEDDSAWLARFDWDGAGDLRRTATIEVGPFGGVQPGRIRTVGDLVLVPGYELGMYVVRSAQDRPPIYVPIAFAQR